MTSLRMPHAHAQWSVRFFVEHRLFRERFTWLGMDCTVVADMSAGVL